MDVVPKLVGLRSSVGLRRRARHSLATVAGALAVCSLVAGCGDDANGGEVVTQALPASVQGFVEPAGERPVVWARDLVHETAVAYALCALPGCTEIELIGFGGDADDVAFVEGSLWVAPGRGGEQLRIVDPAGGTEVIGPPMGTPTRIAPSGENVFVASAFDLYRFDAANPAADPAVVRWTAEGEGVEAILATADATFVFGHAGEVARLDPVTLQVTARGRLPGSVPRPGAVAVGASGLYAATTDSGVDVVVRMDPVTLAVGATRELESDVIEAAVAVAGDALLVAAGAELLELDPVTLEPRGAEELPITVALGVVSLGDRVWVVSPLGVAVIDR